MASSHRYLSWSLDILVSFRYSLANTMELFSCSSLLYTYTHRHTDR